MRNIKLEKTITKMDNDIVALSTVRKYLTNLDEINDVRDELNKKRQLLVNELYIYDGKSYGECCEFIQGILDKELGKEEQLELLEMIREKYGRQAPEISKKSNGLNAWLKELNLEYDWIEKEESDWVTLIITGFGVRA